MIDSIVVFGRELPIYGLLWFVGILCSCAFAAVICKKYAFPIWEAIYSGIYAMIGALIGAKLLFIAVSFKIIIEYNLSIVSVIKSGFVFYGGLIGGLIGVLIYTKAYKEHSTPYLDIISAVLPLGHAVGRVGCFFAGCCYGIPCPFGVVYEHTQGLTPLGVKLLPIQLIESFFLLIIFLIQLSVLKKKKLGGYCTFSYLLMYSLLRVVTEFFRGDTERGELLFFSTSQWVSVGILIASLIYKYKYLDKKTKNECR